MKSSARNQFRGKVSHISTGPVSAEVEVSLDGKDRIVAVISRESFENLGIEIGTEVYALLKALWVIVTTDEAGLAISVRNRLCGTISSIKTGHFGIDITLTLAGGAKVVSVVTDEALTQLGLNVGDRACAVFKETSVILAVPR